MKKGWVIKRLPEIAEYFIGLTYSPKDVGNKGTIVLRSSNVQNDELDLSDLVRVTCSVKKPLHVRKGDILMCSRNGSKRLVGKTAVIGDLPEEMTFGTFMTVIRSELNPYLSWFFRSEAFRDQIGVGENTMINQITKYMLDVIRVPFPPLAEQQRIVGLLDEAFEGLATAKANADKNLQNARALFESHIQAVFTQRGPGWVEKPLGEALVKTETTDPTRSPQTEFDYIDVSSVSKETLAIQETQRLQGKDAPSRARKLVRTNDVIFATIRPTLRRIAIVPDELDSQVCSTGYFVLRAKPDMDHRLVFYFLQTETFMTAMETLQKGASYPAVTDGDVRLQTIPIPPLNEQKTIAAKLESLREETQRLTRLYEQKHVALEALKKSLLHQAFTGEL